MCFYWLNKLSRLPGLRTGCPSTTTYRAPANMLALIEPLERAAQTVGREAASLLTCLARSIGVRMPDSADARPPQNPEKPTAGLPKNPVGPRRMAVSLGIGTHGEKDRVDQLARPGCHCTP